MRDVLFGDTITIYNHYRNGREDAWQRTVLRGVQYKKSSLKTVGSGGSNGAVGIVSVGDTVSVTIPVNVDAGGRHYLEPGTFQSTGNRGSYWTLNTAGNLDVLVKGACTQEVAGAFTLADLKAAYPDSYATIKSAADNTERPRLKHYKVVAV